MSENTDIIKRNWNILPKVVKVFIATPPVFIDGCIVALVAMLTTLATAFSQEEAYKYIHPTWLFWTKITVGSVTAGLVALQSFRSKVFAEHVSKTRLADSKENG